MAAKKKTNLWKQEERESNPWKEWIAKQNELYKDHHKEAELYATTLYKHGWFFYKMFMSKIDSWKHYAMISFDRRNDMDASDQAWKTNVVTPFTYILCKSLYEKIYGFKHEADVLIKPDLKSIEKMNPTPATEWEEKEVEKNNDEQSKSIEGRLNKIVESSELLSHYADIIEWFINHGSSWVRLDFNFNDEYFERKEENKRLAVEKKDLLPYTTEMFDTQIEVYDTYNFLYDQRRSNVYKSSFFQYINYEPLHEVLERWKNFIEPKDIEEIKKNIWQWGLYNGMPDFKRFKELEAIDAYVTNSLDVISKDTAGKVWAWLHIVGENKRAANTQQYFTQTVVETDYCVQEHYTKDYITLMLAWVAVAVVDNPYSKHSKWKIFHPYVQFNITSAPHKALNKSVPERLSTLQKLNDMIYNGFSDQMKMSLRPMFQSDGSLQMTDAGNLQDRLKYEPYKIIETMGGGKLNVIELWQVNNSILTIMDFIQGMGQIITSITRYTWGGKQGVERSATGADLMADITNDAVRPTQFGMADATNRIFKLAMIMTKEYLGDKIEGEEWELIDLSAITKVNDLAFNITFKSDSVSDLLESKYINKVTTILTALRPEILNMANLPDGQFLNIRKIFRELFSRIDEEGFVFNDEEVQAYIDRVKVLNEQYQIENAKKMAEEQESLANSPENNVSENGNETRVIDPNEL
jgi:hypothetical protein